MLVSPTNLLTGKRYSIFDFLELDPSQWRNELTISPESSLKLGEPVYVMNKSILLKKKDGFQKPNPKLLSTAECGVSDGVV